MKSKILLHHTNHNTYRTIVKTLVQQHSDDLEIVLQIVHKNLFHYFNQNKPDIVFLPVAEYTQEFHDFIQEHRGDTRIALLIDRNIDNDQLVKFWKDVGLSLIVSQDLSAGFGSHKHIVCPRLYDSDIFSNMFIERNNKIAVILSSDQSKNDRILSAWLYPQNSLSRLVLFNNPEFKHPQNIGIFNNSDLNMILNSFSYLIDIDNQYALEANVCGIQNLDADNIKDINNTNTCPLKPFSLSEEELSQLTYRSFVRNNLIPFLN